MSQEQAVVALIIHALISAKNKSSEKRKKGEPVWNLRLKEEKNFGFFETLLAELRLEEKNDYNILLWMTSENFEEIFQLINDGITKENTKIEK